MTDTTTVVAAFRRAADLLEQNPDLPRPLIHYDATIGWRLWDFECPDGIPAMVAKIRRAVGGKWDKRESHSYGEEAQMVFEREGFRVTVEREAVCTRRVVGTETVTLPAVEAAPERTVERELVEWDCAPILSEVAC